MQEKSANSHANKDTSDTVSTGAKAATARRKLSTAALATGVLLGTLLVLSLTLVILIVGRRGGLPTIDRDDLATAARRWEEHGPRSYDLDVTIRGRQPGLVHVEVRDGKVTAMTRDDVTPAQRRTWEYWTVPEQFETIGQDLESAQRVGGFGAPPGTTTVIRAEFDPRYGYPRHYQRLVLGTDLDVEWETTRFAPID